MKIIDCEQRSDEWLKARSGIPTASNFDKIITTKGEPSKQAQKYIYRLAGERITGIQEETYQNGNMIRGNELEAEARNLYQVITDETITEVGFCRENGYGASPDGMVGPKGLIQIKCPISSTHVGYLLDQKLPTDYFQQIQGELLVTGRQWTDFFSYYPAMNPLIVRVERDEDFIKKLKAELKEFCQKLAEVVKKIK